MFLLPKPKSGAVHCEVEAPLERNIIGFKIEKTCIKSMSFFILSKLRLARSKHRSLHGSIRYSSNDLYSATVYKQSIIHSFKFAFYIQSIIFAKSYLKIRKIT